MAQDFVGKCPVVTSDFTIVSSNIAANLVAQGSYDGCNLGVTYQTLTLKIHLSSTLIFHSVLAQKVRIISTCSPPPVNSVHASWVAAMRLLLVTFLPTSLLLPGSSSLT